MKSFVILILLSFPIRGLTQPLTDSTKTVEVARWVMWRMIAEVNQGRLCDTLRVQLGQQVNSAMGALVVADSVIEAQKLQIMIRDEGIKVREETLVIKDKMAEELKKDLKRQKRLKWITVGGSVLLFVLLL